MQPQFESVRLAAQAYEQQLRADADRTRSISRAEPGRHVGESVLGAGRRAMGIASRACQRL
jgi:hypothetical protein